MSIGEHTRRRWEEEANTSACFSIRQHTSDYVSIREHTRRIWEEEANIRDTSIAFIATLAPSSAGRERFSVFTAHSTDASVPEERPIRQHCVSIHQHTSAYVSTRKRA